MPKKLIFVFYAGIALSSAQAERPMVPLTQWVGQLPTTQLTGVDIYHHPDLLPFLQAIWFDPDQPNLSSNNLIPKVQQIDHYLIIQGYDCSLHDGCQWGHAILYDLDKKQAAICQQSLVWVFHSFPSDKPDGKPIASSFQAQILALQQQNDDQIVKIVDGDLFTGCGNLKAEPAFALKQFLRFFKN